MMEKYSRSDRNFRNILIIDYKLREQGGALGVILRLIIEALYFEHLNSAVSL